MIRRALLAALLALAAAAEAQTPLPRADIAELRSQAKRDPAIRAALADPSRNLESRLRDEGRMVEIMLKAANATTGERVLDVGAGGGYLSLLFSTLVGKTGHVDLHNTPGWIAQFPSMDPGFQRGRIKQANIGWITAPWNDLDGPAASYDLIVLGQVYHDVILEAGDFEALNERFFQMLKPGGRILIEDHDASSAMPLAQQVGLHRISRGNVEAHLELAGFVLTQSVVMESSFDDQRFNVFRPGVRGRTDRFIVVFEKPSDPNPAG
jgi:predicted methyltransferase